MVSSAVKYLSSEDEELVVESDYKIPFAALCAQLEVAGVRDKIYYKSFKASAAFKNWTKGIKDLELFIEDKFPKLTEAEELALYQVMYKLLIVGMYKLKTPVTLATVANNTARCQEVLNIGFPEYIKSGLGYLIIAAMSGKGKE